MSDLISRQAAKEHFYMYVPGLAWDKIDEILDDVPSAQPELPENWWKTDHGYMWLCPHCGLPVHSDFEECLRCGIKRQSEQPEFARDINVPSTETAERTAKTSQNVPNDDLISRKAAIERLREFANDDMTSTEKAIGADYCVDLIRTMPSAHIEPKTADSGSASLLL